MLSWPRFEPYRNRPEGAICTSAQVLWPEKSGGRVGRVLISVSVPFDPS